MHTSVTSLRIQPAKVDEFIQAYKGIAQSISGVQELQGAQLLANRETGGLMVLGLWDSEANAKAFETSLTFTETLGKFKEALTEPPKREYFETSFQIDYG